MFFVNVFVCFMAIPAGLHTLWVCLHSVQTAFGVRFATEQVLIPADFRIKKISVLSEIFLMAIPAGLHSLARVSSLRSDRLRRPLRDRTSSYPCRLSHKKNLRSLGDFSYGDPGRIRTCDPQLRRLLLYPTELRDRFLELIPFFARIVNTFIRFPSNICFSSRNFNTVSQNILRRLRPLARLRVHNQRTLKR